MSRNLALVEFRRYDDGCYTLWGGSFNCTCEGVVVRTRLFLKGADDGWQRGAVMVRCSKVMVVKRYGQHIRDGERRTATIPTSVGGGRR